MSNNNKGNWGITSLPDDILVDILARLPAKVLGQCKCICKLWRSLIEDPSFVDLHHTRAKSRPDGCFLVISLCTHHYSDIQFFSADYRGGPAQHLLTHSNFGYYYVTPSVNGLICGFHATSKSIFVFNPTTREIVTLPPSRITRDKPPSSYGPCISFGFDPSTKQYKVLNMVCTARRNSQANLDDLEEEEEEEYDHECEIFTLGTHSWRRLDVVLPHFHFGWGSRCVNGIVHWRNTLMTELGKPPTMDGFIVALDLKDEKTQLIPLPRGPSCMPRLLEVGGHLAACDFQDQNHVEELWILQDYYNWSWVKESILPPSDWVREDGPYTVGAIQTGEILLRPDVETASHLLSIYYYDRNRKSFRKIEITGLPKSVLPVGYYAGILDELYVTNYVENLFSLRSV